MQVICAGPGIEREPVAAGARPAIIAALEQELVQAQGALRGKTFVEMQRLVQAAFEKVAFKTTCSQELGMLAELVSDVTTQLYVKCIAPASPVTSPSSASARVCLGGGVAHQKGGDCDSQDSGGLTSTAVMGAVMDCIANRYPPELTTNSEGEVR